MIQLYLLELHCKTDDNKMLQTLSFHVQTFLGAAGGTVSWLMLAKLLRVGIVDPTLFLFSQR